MSRPRTKERRQSERGSVMLLVMIVIAIAFILGVTFLTRSVTLTDAAADLSDHAQARQIAESGLAAAIRYIQQTPNWRSDADAGPWMTEVAWLDGTVTVSASFDDTPATTTIAIQDADFEQESVLLPAPNLNPPMTGTIGGWDIERSAAIQTGVTIPLLGTMDEVTSLDGDLEAFILFPLAVNGAALFGQTLAEPLAPNTNYVLTVEVGRAGLAVVLADFDLRVRAGTTLIASATTPSIFTAFNESNDPSVLTSISLSPALSEYTLRFTTDDNPPAGPIRIELYAKSQIGVVSQVLFDNVSLEVESYSPVTLTAVGRHGDASHSVTAVVAQPYPAGATALVKWSEP